MNWARLGTQALVVALALRPESVGGQQPSYYRGTVLRDGQRDAPAILEFAVSEETDTSIAGWLRVGQPLSESGFAYAVTRASDSLRMVSLSIAGDTIDWVSATKGRRIGGSYSFRAGPSAGQTGTWTLSATSDPSKSSRVGMAVAGGLTLIVALFFASRRLAPPWWRAKAAAMAAAGERRTELTGIGGWLGYAVFAFTIGVVVLFWQLLTNFGNADGAAWLMGETINGYRPLLVMESSVQVAQVAGTVVGLVLLLKRRAETPVFWLLLMGILSLYCVLDFIAVAEMGRVFTAKFGKSLGSEFMLEANAEAQKNLRLLLRAVLWAWYWHVSKRVQFTFDPGQQVAPDSFHREPSSIVRVE